MTLATFLTRLFRPSYAERLKQHRETVADFLTADAILTDACLRGDTRDIGYGQRLKQDAMTRLLRGGR